MTKLFADINILLSTIGTKIRILANNADPDAHLISLHCLLIQNRLSVKECIFSENITCGPSIYTIGHRLLH